MAIVAGLVGQRSNAWLHNLRQGRCGGKTIAALGRGSQVESQALAEAAVGKLGCRSVFLRFADRLTTRRSFVDRVRWYVRLRKIKGEGAPPAGNAYQANLASQQSGQLTADGQAESRAAIFATGAPVRLLECFKDDLLLFLGDADAGVRNREGQHRGRAIENLVVGIPAASGPLHCHNDMAAMREFERIGQEVFEHLLQPLGIRENRIRQPRFHVDFEVDALGLGYVAEGALHVVVQIVQSDLAGVDNHGPGFDLGQIENVINQHEQVIAR